jgi:hypothetical protein
MSTKRYLIVDVEDAFLNFVVDFSGGVDERLLHVGRRLGRRLHEDEAVLASERLPLLSLDVAPSLEVAEKGRKRKWNVALCPVWECLLRGKARYG